MVKQTKHVFVYECMCLSEPKEIGMLLRKTAQRWEYGVIELCEVPDTLAVTASLNVVLISHQSPSVSGEEATADSAISSSELRLRTIQPPQTSSEVCNIYAEHRESSTFKLFKRGGGVVQWQSCMYTWVHGQYIICALHYDGRGKRIPSMIYHLCFFGVLVGLMLRSTFDTA